jgi:hypothetical protein
VKRLALAVPAATIDAFLRDLAAHLGQPARDH